MADNGSNISPTTLGNCRCSCCVITGDATDCNVEIAGIVNIAFGYVSNDDKCNTLSFEASVKAFPLVLQAFPNSVQARQK